MLGHLDVRRGEAALELGGYKQRALMALLLINANTVVSTDRIIDELWGDSDGKDRQNALWAGISRLRTALEPDRPKRSDGTILVTQQPGYLLSIDADEIDATRFEALAREGRSLLDTDPGAGSLVLSEALALWSGHALEEFTYESFAAPEIERLEELRLAAVEDRIDADLRIGRAGALVGELESLVRQHPLRQRLAGHLMLALHLSGRQGDALRAFGALRTRLAEELGLDPSAELSKLEERIVLDDPSLGRSAAVQALSGRPEPGLSVRGYELREKIGEGSLGHVYRAFQPAVGREVAIKVIRPDLANDPDFIRRFESEAKVIASLEHPQIVPVFDYWREPDSAFLVMRRFEHGSLADAVAGGPLATEAAVRILAQIGGALAATHRRGLTHGDVKPENVLLDGDGNAYLADFGMSFRPVGDQHAEAAPRNAFAAPEQRGETAATPASDIYSFGALVDVALRGAVGNGALPDSPLVGPVAEIVDRAMAVDPADRFADVETFLDALASAFGEPEAAGIDDGGVDVDIANPYRGLRAFAEDDAAQFFGRERLVERLVARLGHAGPQGRFVALVGPSGSGKSSVIRAGLVPALRSGAVTGSDRWFIVTMTPGRHPFDALDDAVRTVAVNPPANLLDRLTTDGISSAVEAVIPDPSSQIVIVVDQLEELFSLAERSEADAFLDALAAVAADRLSPVKVVATMRADFYDRPLRHPSFGELLRLGTEVITPMNPAELERAITAPSEAVGVSFEPGLVSMITADMTGQATALPLMQYALTELFEQRVGRQVGADAYRELGGVAAALARRADSVFDGLEPAVRSAVRDVFLRLVTINDGAADTRRRALLSELVAAAGDDVTVALDAFGRHRLLSFDRDPITRGPTVEIAHEALLTEWTRLDHWIDDARADVAAQRRLAATAAEWRERGDDRDFLLTGAQLTRYDGWSERPPVRLTEQERGFLAASHDAAAVDEQVEQRRIRRLRRLVTGVAAALVVALVAGGLAVRAQRRADDEADRAVQAAEDAELATLISRSAATGDDDPELALLLALEANERAPGSATEQAVLDALGRSSIGNRIASRQPLVDDCIGNSVFVEGFAGEYGPGIELATVDGRMLAREPRTGQIQDSGPAPAPCMVGGVDENGNGLAASMDGTFIVGGPNLDVPLAITGGGNFAQISTGDRAVVGSFGDNSSVQIYDLTTGAAVGPSVPGFVTSSAVTFDGSMFAVGLALDEGRSTEGALLIIDAESGDVLVELDVPPPNPLAFDPTTGHVIAGFDDRRVITVDPLTGDIVTDVRPGGVTSYIAAGVRADGTLIMVSRNGIDFVDRRSGATITQLETQNVIQAYVRPDDVVVTVSDRGQTDVYDLGGSALLGRVWDVDPQGIVSMADGRAAIANPRGPLVEIVDLATGDRTTPDLRSSNGDPFVPQVAYPEPDGVWAIDFELVLGRWEGDRLVDELDVGSDPSVVDHAWYVGGRRYGDFMAVLGKRPDNTTEASLVRLDRAGASVVFTIDTGIVVGSQDNGLGMAHPTMEGGLYVVDESGMLRIYDSSGVLVDEVATGATEPVAMTLDPSGSKLAIASLQGLVVVFDTVTSEVDRVPGPVIASSLGFDDDGSQLGISVWGGAVRLYDVENGGVPAIVWNGSGTFGNEPGWYDTETSSLWLPASGTLIEIPLDPQQWVERACAVVDRSLTQEEWDRYVPGDEPLRSVCS
jgi:DNA-binding SARP family transcriptional activator/sugar lactone lactonase YvrE